MTLEDFFTLTEMKDGLATLSRVEELVSMMRNQKDCLTSNIGDAARQWSSVASTLAATENKDCLDHFIRLKGLDILNLWLLEAQKCQNDCIDNVAEELISSILASLERLPVDRETSSASGIGMTIEPLLVNKSINIKERAKTLLDKWNHMVANDVSCQDSGRGTEEKDQAGPSTDSSAINNEMQSICPATVISESKVNSEKCAEVESNGSDYTLANDGMRSEDSLLDTKGDIKDSGPNHSTALVSVSDVVNSTEGHNGPFDSVPASKLSEDNLSIADKSIAQPSLALIPSDTCKFSSIPRRVVGDQQDVSDFKHAVDGCKQMVVGAEEASPFVSEPKTSKLSSSEKDEIEADAMCDFHSRKSKSGNLEGAETRMKCDSVDCVTPEDSKVIKELEQVAHVAVDFQDSSRNGCSLRRIDGPGAYCLKKEPSGSVNSSIEHISEKNLKAKKAAELVAPRDFSTAVKTVATGEAEKKLDSRLEYDMDPLEVARQVAIEVEREVVDYREPFCGSPDINSRDIMDAGSPEMTARKDDSLLDELNVRKSPSGKDVSDSPSSTDDSSKTSLNDIAYGDDEQDKESQKAATVVQESVNRFERNICDFDLNEDICVEDFNCSTSPIPNTSVNLTGPIVVAASKGAPTLPVTPLHFEGGHGWRGSAATSAFRPASLRKTLDGEKAFSGVKQKSACLEIDLNVAEAEDVVVDNPVPVRQVPVSSDLRSGDSSLEVSSAKAERLKLDLNRLEEEDVPPFPSSYWRFYHQNGAQSLSPASSSSSRQPLKKDFDLNDNPAVLEAGGFHNLTKSSFKPSSNYGNPKVDDPAIMIMGSRMPLQRKDYGDQAQQSFLGNGLCLEPAVAATHGLPYSNMSLPAYGYAALAPGPALPISPAPYGPGGIPYMVDSRGATVIPQVIGPMGVSGAPTSTMPHFLMSVTSASSNLNGAGSFRPSLDLNCGMITSMEGGDREGGSLKQTYVHAHNFLEEKTTAASQPASSGMTLKRKEPDCGWEPYGYSYKQVTSWQ